MKTTVTLEKITPEIATEWLSDKWGEQRAIRLSHVKRLASDMSSGRFKTGPDAILRIKGKLANGQHRLSAVVMSGKAHQFIVMDSSDEELYKAIDDGMKRTAGDSMMGIPYARDIPAVARWVQAYEDGGNIKSARQPSEALSKSSHGEFVTKSQIVDYCIGNKEILCEAVGFVLPLNAKTRLLNPSIGAAIYVIASSKGCLEKAKEFLQELYMTGGQSSAGDLRNRLIGNIGSRSKLNKGYLFALTLKAFKSYVNGTRPGTLKIAKDEALPTL